MVCLISADGSATLHRLAPLSDSSDTAQLLEEICSTVGPGSGANCVASLASVDSMDMDNDDYSSSNTAIEASSQQQQQQQQDMSGASNGDRDNSKNKKKARRHFQEGNIDEFCFIAPDLGPLASIIIGPESGSWYCDEINVSCSSTGHTDRFVCRDVLGGKDRPAAFLTPIPPGSVVYGSGDAAVLLTKEQADRMQKVNMQDYDYLKKKLLTTTASLTALGGVGIYAIGGVDLAAPLLMGGAAGLVYQAALQKSIDGLGNNGSASSSSSSKTVAEHYYSKPRVGSEMQQSRAMVVRIATGNPVVRMVAVASCLGALFVLLQLGGEGDGGGVILSSLGGIFTESTNTEYNNGSGGGSYDQVQVKQAVALCAGFLMNKVAVLTVAASSPSPSSVDRVKDMGGKDDESRKSADRVE